MEHLAGASQRKSATTTCCSQGKKSTAGFFFSFICGKIFFWHCFHCEWRGDEKGAVIFLMSSVSWLVKMVPSFSFPPPALIKREFFQKVLFSTVGKARDGAKKIKCHHRLLLPSCHLFVSQSYGKRKGRKYATY